MILLMLEEYDFISANVRALLLNVLYTSILFGTRAAHCGDSVESAIAAKRTCSTFNFLTACFSTVEVLIQVVCSTIPWLEPLLLHRFETLSGFCPRGYAGQRYSFVVWRRTASVHDYLTFTFRTVFPAYEANIFNEVHGFNRICTIDQVEANHSWFDPRWLDLVYSNFTKAVYCPLLVVSIARSWCTLNDDLIMFEDKLDLCWTNRFNVDHLKILTRICWTF